MSTDAGALVAIAVMAATAALNRTAGFFLMRLVPVTPRVRRVLDALPGALLVALVVPGAVHGDLGMMVGLAVALLAAKLSGNDFVAVIAAMATAAAIRAFMP